MTDDEAINDRLDRFRAMLAGRDPAIVDELWGAGGFVLVGSEEGEIYRGRAALEAKFAAIFGRPATFHMDFPQRTVTVVGPVGWVLAEGRLGRREPDGSESARTYIASCIFERRDGGWHWRQFHGSEPY